MAQPPRAYDGPTTGLPLPYHLARAPLELHPCGELEPAGEDAAPAPRGYSISGRSKISTHCSSFAGSSTQFATYRVLLVAAAAAKKP
jgi:hypothetical protein